MKIELQKPDRTKYGPVVVGPNIVKFPRIEGLGELSAMAQGNKEIKIAQNGILLDVLGEANLNFGLVDPVELDKSGRVQFYVFRYLKD